MEGRYGDAATGLRVRPSSGVARSDQILICGILTEVGKHRVTDVLIKTSQVVLSRMVNLKPVSIKESVELGVDKRLRSNFIVAIYVIELVFSVSHS